jgi:hypothetical protein
VDLNSFFMWLDGHVDGGMANVWVSLTGDHGIGPTIPQAEAAHMPAAVYSLGKVIASLDEQLNAKYSPGQELKYIFESEVPYITLDPRVFASVKVTEAEAEKAVAELLPGAFGATQGPAATGPVGLPTRALLRHAYTKTQMAAGELPDTPEGHLILNSYSPNGEWYVLMTPGMYEQAQAQGTNHYTPYSYDRHVPLGFFGSPFVPGLYHEAVEPVDIAATFASLLRVNRPTAAVGHVLTFALKPGE